MKARSLCAAVMVVTALLSAVAFPQEELSDIMDGRVSWPFDGLTPQNVEERIRPYLDRAERAETDQEKARYYIFLTQVVEGRIGAASAQHVAIGLADKALSFDLSPLDRADMLGHKGSAVRKMHGSARGEALREPRREVMTLWLEVYQITHVYAKGLADELAKYPGFDPDFAPMDSHLPREDFEGPVGMGPPQEGVENYQAWVSLTEKHRSMLQKQSLLKGYEGAFIDLYAREPYDLDELRTLFTDTIGDADLADDLVERTKKEIASRLRKRYVGDQNQLFIDALDEIDALTETDAPAESTAPATFPSAPAPAPATPDTAPDGNGMTYLLLLSLAVAVVLAAAIIWKRRSPRP